MSNLDQLVKGAPPPESHFPVPSTSPIISTTDAATASSMSDPLASLPSSPPQIYLNLLILEASLRAQWLQLRSRRRQHAFFLTLLGLWVIWFGYALFLAPREDGSGVGGSVYWVVEVTEKVCFMGGIVTGILVWGTGQWERGIRWPRRWVGTTNRGLRGFNCKLVVVKESWAAEMMSMLSFLFSYGLFSTASRSSYRYIDQSLLMESEKTQQNTEHLKLPNIHEDDRPSGYEDDLAPGGDHVKLLLLPKPFSPNFREKWDEYRTEYWEQENDRRAVLRKKLKERETKLAKEQGGWLWWTGYRGWNRSNTSDLEKTHHNSQRLSGMEKEQRRIRSGSIRGASHSRNGSRSNTPTPELEEGAYRSHARRTSTTSNASDRRKMKGSVSSRTHKITPSGPQSATPEVHSSLLRDNSYTSTSSWDSERPQTPVGADTDSARSLNLSAKPGGSPARKLVPSRAVK